MKPIGGYFGLEIDEKKEFYADLLRVNSGRNALRLYLREKAIQKIYVPIYICDSVIKAIEKENVSIDFYNISENFNPIFPKVADNKAYILCVNYFGICEDKIFSIRKKFKNVIIDNSQAFFSKPFPGSITFYSPRKFFGVPDGGYLHSDLRNNIKLERDFSYNRALHHLIWHDIKPEKGYEEFSKNENFFNELDIKKMSNLTRKILCSIDYKQVKKKREENFFYLHERLFKINGIDVNQNYVNGPMVYPFMFDNKKLRDELIKNRIFCGKYWKEVSDRGEENSIEHKFSESIIALPIDQRFSIIDMKRIISNIENCLEKKLWLKPNYANKEKKLKTQIEDLAIFGGNKAFRRPLHVGGPNDVNRDILRQKIDQLLETKRFTNRGPFVRKLESKIAEFIGVKHCILMCNATIALEIVFRALGLQGEVIVPSMTFIATAHALQWQQIKPVFCDIHPFTYNINSKCIKKMITPNTSGIVGVHLWGRPCEIEELEDIAHKRNLKLIFDAAHAFGCSYKGKMIGQFGDAEVFSFHATKFINTFEGGAVVTNNDELAEKIRLMQNFGFAGKDNVIYIGTNGKMSEISAAMGITSLESYEEITSTNYNNYKLYERVFDGLPGMRMLAYNEKEVCNYQYIVLEIDQKITQISRDTIMQILHAENVIARRYFYPGCHRMEPYKSYQPYAALLVPVTEKLVKRILTLPNGTSISERHIHKIGQIFHYVLANANEISGHMRKIDMPVHNRSNLAFSNNKAVSM